MISKGLITILSFCFFTLVNYHAKILPKIERYLKFYKKLSDSKDWDGNLTSSIHAIMVTTWFVATFIAFPRFHSKHDLFYSPFFCEIGICFSLGYFLYDLIVIIPKDFKSNIQYLPHHLLSILSIVLGLHSGKYYLGMMLLLCMEGSTPFINNIYFLKKLNLRKHPVFILNGILIVFTWILFRYIIGVGYFVFLVIFNWEEYKKRPILGIYWIFMELGFTIMNTIWFIKICKGFVKLVFKQ